VFIQNDVNINDTPVSKIIIGENTAIGAGCSIIGVGHDLDVKTRSTPMNTTSSFGQDIIIGKGVMVGTHAVILPGTVLGDFSIVTANCTVNGKIIPAHYTTDGKTM
jgi:acetyltransferase-like isoleucine patch superfamily enzyme